MTPTDSLWTEQLEHMIAVWVTLDRCHRDPPTIKSNFAREGALHIAICASTGLITVEVEDDLFCNKWMITEEGKYFKEALDEDLRSFIK